MDERSKEQWAKVARKLYKKECHICYTIAQAYLEWIFCDQNNNNSIHEEDLYFKNRHWVPVKDKIHNYEEKVRKIADTITTLRVARKWKGKMDKEDVKKVINDLEKHGEVNIDTVKDIEASNTDLKRPGRGMKVIKNQTKSNQNETPTLGTKEVTSHMNFSRSNMKTPPRTRNSKTEHRTDGGGRDEIMKEIRSHRAQSPSPSEGKNSRVDGPTTRTPAKSRSRSETPSYRRRSARIENQKLKAERSNVSIQKDSVAVSRPKSSSVPLQSKSRARSETPSSKKLNRSRTPESKRRHALEKEKITSNQGSSSQLGSKSHTAKAVGNRNFSAQSESKARNGTSKNLSETPQERTKTPTNKSKVPKLRILLPKDSTSNQKVNTSGVITKSKSRTRSETPSSKKHKDAFVTQKSAKKPTRNLGRERSPSAESRKKSGPNTRSKSETPRSVSPVSNKEPSKDVTGREKRRTSGSRSGNKSDRRSRYNTGNSSVVSKSKESVKTKNESKTPRKDAGWQKVDRRPRSAATPKARERMPGSQTSGKQKITTDANENEDEALTMSSGSKAKKTNASSKKRERSQTFDELQGYEVEAVEPEQKRPIRRTQSRSRASSKTGFKSTAADKVTAKNVEKSLNSTDKELKEGSVREERRKSYSQSEKSKNTKLQSSDVIAIESGKSRKSKAGKKKEIAQEESKYQHPRVRHIKEEENEAAVDTKKPPTEIETKMKGQEKTDEATKVTKSLPNTKSADHIDEEADKKVKPDNQNKVTQSHESNITSKKIEHPTVKQENIEKSAGMRVRSSYLMKQVTPKKTTDRSTAKEISPTRSSTEEILSHSVSEADQMRTQKELQAVQTGEAGKAEVSKEESKINVTSNVSISDIYKVILKSAGVKEEEVKKTDTVNSEVLDGLTGLSVGKKRLLFSSILNKNKKLFMKIFSRIFNDEGILDTKGNVDEDIAARITKAIQTADEDVLPEDVKTMLLDISSEVMKKHPKFVNKLIERTAQELYRHMTIETQGLFMDQNGKMDSRKKILIFNAYNKFMAKNGPKKVAKFISRAYPILVFRLGRKYGKKYKRIVRRVATGKTSKGTRSAVTSVVTGADDATVANTEAGVTDLHDKPEHTGAVADNDKAGEKKAEDVITAFTSTAANTNEDLEVVTIDVKGAASNAHTVTTGLTGAVTGDTEVASTAGSGVTVDPYGSDANLARF